MKIGFTSRVCPGWDLPTIAAKAAEFGFEGVELAPDSGQSESPVMRALAADPDGAKRTLSEKNVELVCLGSAVTFDSPEPRDLDAGRRKLLESVELASRVGCPFVRVALGHLPKGVNRYGALSSIADALAALAPEVARRHATLLLENGGDYPGSRDLWFVIDHVSHPAVAACWDPVLAMTQLERPTLSVPRLGKKIQMVHISDGTFDDRGRFGGYKLPGEGGVGIARMIDLLRGIVYRGYLMFDWPKAAVSDLPAAEEALPKVKAWLRERIEARAEPLTAYKGDKQAVKFKLPPGMAAPAAAAKPVKAKH